MTRRKQDRFRSSAIKLLKDPRFFQELLSTVAGLGVVGEESNVAALYVACLTKDLPRPVSTIVKGTSSSGKSHLVRTVLRLFPSEDVIERSSLTAKALVSGEEPLAGRILYISEYKGGKDAQYLIRLQQSEGKTKHEFTTINGPQRSTNTSEREGSPVVITTTTEDRIFEDDETRFLSLRADESPGQTLRIVKAQAMNPVATAKIRFSVWHEVARLFRDWREPIHRPDWLQYVAQRLPAQNVRVRRDWLRFLSLCEAIARLRLISRNAKETPEILFQDYCIAYRIFDNAFQKTLSSAPKALRSMLSSLHGVRGVTKTVTAADVGRICDLSPQRAYRYVQRAQKLRLLVWDGVRRPKNQKRFTLREDAAVRFLPTPASVFQRNQELGTCQTYVHPLTGAKRKLTRKHNKGETQYGKSPES